MGRFKASFVKQFAGQEFYSLLRRTRGSDPLCLTLVAAERPADVTNGAAPSKAEGPVIGPGSCLGTLDVRVLSEAAAAQMEAMGGRWPDSVPRQPTGGPAAAYISNVVVAPSRRGRGLGRALVSAATALAQERWGAAQLYCHVERDNQVSSAGIALLPCPPDLPCKHQWHRSSQRPEACSPLAVSRPLLPVRAPQAALALYRACHFRQLGPELPPEDEGQGEGRWQERADDSGSGGCRCAVLGQAGL